MISTILLRYAFRLSRISGDSHKEPSLPCILEGLPLQVSEYTVGCPPALTALLSTAPYKAVAQNGMTSAISFSGNEMPIPPVKPFVSLLLSAPSGFLQLARSNPSASVCESSSALLQDIQKHTQPCCLTVKLVLAPWHCLSIHCN